MNLVVDASVAVKWFLPSHREPFSDKAMSVKQRLAAGQLRIVVPDLFWAETANVFWKAIRQKRWNAASATTALASLQEADLSTVSSLSILDRAFEIATFYDQSLRDCLYVALAVDAKTQLITADEKLANALAARFPVKWLGAI
jgi:predicted nucleic acid-binding protein